MQNQNSSSAYAGFGFQPAVEAFWYERRLKDLCNQICIVAVKRLFNSLEHSMRRSLGYIVDAFVVPHLDVVELKVGVICTVLNGFFFLGVSGLSEARSRLYGQLR